MSEWGDITELGYTGVTVADPSPGDVWVNTETGVTSVYGLSTESSCILVGNNTSTGDNNIIIGEKSVAHGKKKYNYW